MRQEYLRAYQNYLRSLRRFYKKYGVAVEPIGRVKRPTAGSLRRLSRERERVRDFYRNLDNSEARAEVELEQVLNTIETGLEYIGNREGSTQAIQDAADDVYDIIQSAIDAGKTALMIMDGLRKLYGNNIEGIVRAINSYIYAVYNGRNMPGQVESGFAVWSGRGARASWDAELARIRGVLL